MGLELERLKRRKKSLKKIEKLINDVNNALLIHYSCESFYDIKDGRSPRITSIAIRNLDSAQTESFSIHQMAERKHIPLDNISEHYDSLEKMMLDDYFQYLRSRNMATWIHWNMRDSNYGFIAIEHRYKVLGGVPHTVPDDHKFDLSRALVDIYSEKYIGHPRLESIMTKNAITNQHFLTGAQEAEAFNNKDFLLLHKSTLKKIDIFENIFRKVAEDRLKVNSGWAEQRGLKPGTVVEVIKTHWLFSTVSIILMIISFFKEIYGVSHLLKFFN